MDPNEILREILELAEDVRNEEASNTAEAVMLAEKVENLHEWLKKGGIFPKEWEMAVNTRKYLAKEGK